jgi:hypothetical protein
VIVAVEAVGSQSESIGVVGVGGVGDGGAEEAVLLAVDNTLESDRSRRRFEVGVVFDVSVNGFLPVPGRGGGGMEVVCLAVVVVVVVAAAALREAAATGAV